MSVSTAYITHQDCSLHDMGSHHPESPHRLEAINRRLVESGLMHELLCREPLAARDEHLLLVHPQSLIDRLRAASPKAGVCELDADTAINPHSLSAAELAAGALITAVDGVMQGDFSRAFCAVRPPGHHAESDMSMGFCLFNNLAIAVRHAMQQYGIKSAAVLDFDVHHGNGTVDIFKDDPAVLVCSSFQHPLYPGRMHDIKRPNIVNTPLPAGTRGDAFRKAVERDWLPALDKHRPEFIFVSAGFDAHRDDPLAQLLLLEADYTWVTDLINSAARDHSKGRVVAALEGGYNLAALANSVYAHLVRLAEL